jgi:hypothetical protein
MSAPQFTYILQYSTAMKRISLFQSVCTVSLITMMATVQAMSLVKAAQANPTAGSTCTATYFDNPGFMYSPATQQQMDAVEKFEQSPDRVKKWSSHTDGITTFSVALDAPMGYAINKVNGKPITIPPKIKQAMDRAVFVDPSQNSRKRVAELNQKYGKYATFGQNITLILSPEQRASAIKMSYESIAYIKSLMTPQQQKEQRDAITALGDCSRSALLDPNNPETWRTVSIDTGVRPDLDRRVREDKTGATFFR